MRNIDFFQGLVAVAVFWPAPAVADAAATRIEPIRSFNLKETVAIRETVAATLLAENKLNLLIADRGSTGRSAILLRSSLDGSSRDWDDLGVPAGGLARFGDRVAAVESVAGGANFHLLSSGEPASRVFLAGFPAAIAGFGDRLVRLLSDGDLTVHEVSGDRAGPGRPIATSNLLRRPELCAKCGPPNVLARGAYVVMPASGDRVAVVDRTRATVHFVGLSGQSEANTVEIVQDDLQRSREMFGQQMKRVAGTGVRPANPALVLDASPDSAGDLFLLVGPFSPASGALVLRVDADGRAVGAYRCAYPVFDPNDGPPRFISVSGRDLFLVTARGQVNVYRSPAASL